METKLITIANIKSENGRHIIKDHEGVVFSFFEKKMDGSMTKAYEGFSAMRLAQNDTVEVGYNENVKDGRTYRNIMFFSDRKETPENQPPFTNPVKVSKEDADRTDAINRAAVVKSMIERGEKYSLQALQEAEQWVGYIKNGMQGLESLTGANTATPVDDIKVDDIPF